MPGTSCERRRSRAAMGAALKRVVDTEIAEKPEAAGKPWKENWSVYACGTIHDLEVAFTPSEAGGTNIAVVANPNE
jgi:hypothetical protein